MAPDRWQATIVPVPDRRLVVAIVLAVAVVGSMAVVVVGQSGGLTRGEPNVDAHLPDNEVSPGTEETLEIQVQNDGTLRTGSDEEQVLTARGVTVEIDDGDPFEVRSGERAIGSIRDGETATAQHRIDVPADVDPGEYEITVDVSYAYTNRDSPSSTPQRLTATESVDVTVVVRDEARFAIGDVTTDVEPGTSGDATVTIENVGTEAAHDARVTLAGGTGVTFDGAEAEAFVGDLEVGDEGTITAEVAIEEAVSGGEKPIEARVTYDDPNGIEREATLATGSLAPAAEQSFAITDLEDTLAVGYDGTVTGTLANEGPRPVDDAVLVLEPRTDSLFVEDSRYALPELEPGEETTFRYPTDVSGQADPGPRQLQFTVEYTGTGATTLETDPISKRAVVDDRADEVTIETVENRVRAGGTDEVVLEITNERPETLSNVDAMVYTDAPLSTVDDRAFVPELAPGESAEIGFELAADAGARERTYPIEIDFEYETERGETVLSDVYQQPVEVDGDADDGGSILPGVLPVFAAIAAVAIGAGVWIRRE